MAVKRSLYMSTHPSISLYPTIPEGVTAGVKPGWHGAGIGVHSEQFTQQFDVWRQARIRPHICTYVQFRNGSSPDLNMSALLS